MFDFLLTPEQKALRDEVRELVRWVPRQMILDMDQERIRFPKEFLREAGRRGLMGVRYPRRWGGRDMDWVATSMVMEEVGTLGYIFACVFAAECLTEPRSGSDFFGTTTVAERRGDHFVLNGQKRFIVGADAADFFLVYARTDPAAKPHEGISCLVVDRGPGVETSYLYGLMGCRGGGAGRMVFRDVVVPAENVVGKLHGGAAVFDTMMIPERLGTAAMTIGAARPALEIATGYTLKRKAFGQPIHEFQGVSFQVAEAAMLLDAARAMVDVTSRAVDAGADRATIRRMVSETKKFVTEASQKAAHHAMQVMGGIGYTDVFPVERIVRDLRLASIWTGTNEVMSLIVASEWYRQHRKARAAARTRDHEADAVSADRVEEKEGA